jgi:hypothetical protein
MGTSLKDAGGFEVSSRVRPVTCMLNSAHAFLDQQFPHKWVATEGPIGVSRDVDKTWTNCVAE